MSGTLSEREQGRVETLQIVVRDETPFLPKVAFTLITLASMGGATFTGLGLGLDWLQIAARWLTLWSLALAGGFLTWRVCYLRERRSSAPSAITNRDFITPFRRIHAAPSAHLGSI